MTDLPNTDGRHTQYTNQPCPWPQDMEIEWPDANGVMRIITVLSGSPVGRIAWAQDGHVLCSVDRDGEPAMFLATAAAVRDAVKAMKERR